MTRIQIYFVSAMRGKDDESERQKDQEKDARHLNVWEKPQSCFLVSKLNGCDRARIP
jgi:hypothetical protein